MSPLHSNQMSRRSSRAGFSNLADDNSCEVWLRGARGVIPLFCSAIDPRSAREISGAII